MDRDRLPGKITVNGVYVTREGSYVAWRPTRVPEDNDSFCAAGFTWAKGVVDQ
jgi:hypothetical protein